MSTTDHTSAPPRLDTLGRIADRLDVPIHRVAYIVRARGIRPTAYAGRLRLWDRAAVARIIAELDAIDGKGGDR